MLVTCTYNDEFNIGEKTCRETICEKNIIGCSFSPKLPCICWVTRNIIM